MEKCLAKSGKCPLVTAHNYTNGICSVCSEREPATYVTSSNRYEIGNAGQLAWFGALVNGTLGAWHSPLWVA